MASSAKNNVMTARHLHLDGESYSEIDLKKAGAHRYWEEETTDIWCVAYAFDQEEPKLWLPGDPVPRQIRNHVEDDGPVYAWNVAFERCMWKAKLGPKYGWPMPRERQFNCTMSEALIMNLPGMLDKAGPAIGGEIEKDKEGHRLMLQMSKPRKLRKAEACPVCGDNQCRDCGPYWHDNDPVKLRRLTKYCMQDVRTEQYLADFVLPMSKSEKKLFHLDARINDRGVFIDKKLCLASQNIVEKATAKIDAQIQRITLGEVEGCNKTTQMVRWLKSMGVETDSIAKDVLEDLLIRDDLDPDARRVLELRQEGSKTSTAKIASMLTRRQKDGRMRGNLQYYGASATGRWAARGTQLQNLTRPKILKGKGAAFDKAIKEALLTITYGSLPLLEIMYDKPLTVVSDCIRSLIVAPRGRELLACDFSNIEGRVVAWQAGQTDKLDAFREYDNGTGPDLYVLQASGIFGVTLQDAKDDFYRNIGKVAELSLGFQGGARAFAKMGKNYGMKLETVSARIIDSASDDIFEKAMENWPQYGKSTGIKKSSWIAAEIIKLAWRAKNYRIAASWRETEDCALQAMNYPGETFDVGVIKYRYVAPFLFCRLPSGRALCYPFAKLRNAKTPWGDMRQQIVYKSTNQFTKRWERKAFYGGLAVENITQAIARDIMAEAMLRTERAGYETVLSVHDEIINEVDKGFGSLDEFRDLMTRNPAWARDIPITASGWRGTRYKKG